MKRVWINCRKLDDMAGFYQVIGKKMKFPDYFGKNLDALWDVLSVTENEYVLTLRGYENFKGRIGQKAEVLEHLLKRADKENGKLTVRLK